MKPNKHIGALGMPEIKEEKLIFLSKAELADALNKEDIKISSEAKRTIDNSNSDRDIFAIYYTNPNILIIKAELITPENFAGFLKK